MDPGKASRAGAKQTAGTCELFLDFSVPCPAQEAHALPDPVLPPRFNLVGGVLEHQVPEGPGCCPLHVLVLAAEQLHELGNAPQPIDLARRDTGQTWDMSMEHGDRHGTDTCHEHSARTDTGHQHRAQDTDGTGTPRAAPAVPGVRQPILGELEKQSCQETRARHDRPSSGHRS